jgi:hypothetical protein
MRQEVPSTSTFPPTKYFMLHVESTKSLTTPCLRERERERERDKLERGKERDKSERVGKRKKYKWRERQKGDKCETGGGECKGAPEASNKQSEEDIRKRVEGREKRGDMR